MRRCLLATTALTVSCATLPGARPYGPWNGDEAPPGEAYCAVVANTGDAIASNYMAIAIAEILLGGVLVMVPSVSSPNTFKLRDDWADSGIIVASTLTLLGGISGVLGSMALDRSSDASSLAATATNAMIFGEDDDADPKVRDRQAWSQCLLGLEKFRRSQGERAGTLKDTQQPEGG